MEMRYDQLSPVPPLTKITKFLIVSCVAIYFTDFIVTRLGFTYHGYRLNEIFGLVPALVREKGWVWQFVTYIFMHGHPFHLLLNMLILWYFGAEIEMRLGERPFLFYFFLCGIGAGLFNYSVNMSVAPDWSLLRSPIIGSSGAIYGVLAAYGIFFGNRYFLVFFLFPMKAKYFVLLMAGIELVMGVETSVQDNVAHFAHLGGMLVGTIYIFLRYIRPGGMSKKNKRDHDRERLKKQFTLIVNQPEESDRNEKGPFWN